ncbi:CRISPR-associated helicase Cas3 [Pyrolobus fumarii 1A]|uniref:CRISPR-associated helicase Cas3 n=1 Tax=Pyrolobus fumarii (strain DSM 11204 / 1A) TaxID=694429 RepID=G0EG56_PYRF1|nr:CRISPR-associated helicase Cas3' [Pyrolobus fumarii]AEM38304.1 CRISPR-associated helicase Cas3 [Pyrolobus fumarii 1A]
MRAGVGELLEIYEASPPERGLFIAPTGYGKSSLVASLASRLVPARIPRVIHALPLRAILEQLYSRLVESGAGLTIGYQAMGLGLSGKTPFMAPQLVLTTYDSLLVNLLRGNVAERGLGHYEAPRAHILSSLIVLDEIHLGLSAEGLLDTLYTSLWALRGMRVQLLLETATMPPGMMLEVARFARPDLIVAVLPGDGECLDSLGLRGVTGAKVHVVVDREFYEGVAATSWEYGLLEQSRVADTVATLAESGRRVLVVIDSVAGAVDVYRALAARVGEDKVALIHGRMAPFERERVVKRLDSIRVLVGTSAVEAGIDADFDVLVTSAAKPSSLLQRMGRVARRPGRLERAEAYIIDDGGDARRLLLALQGVHPRLPCPYRGWTGYTRLLAVEEAPKPRFDARRLALAYAVIDPRRLEMLLQGFCDLVRNDPLVPLVPSAYLERILDGEPLGMYAFPANLSTVAKRGGEWLSWCNGRGVRVVSLEARGEGEWSSATSYSLDCSEALGRLLREGTDSCRAILEAMEREGVAALVVEGYEPGVGLV